MADEDRPAPPPQRSLGPLPATSLVAGTMLGIGIFIAPPVVAAQIEGPGAFLLLWLAGGLSALFGALSVAELGAMMPRAGGDYPYLRLAYGPGIAFAAGWLQLLAVFPGSLAAMSVGTATFQLPILLGDAYGAPARLPIAMDPAMFWAVAIMVGLTAINHLGVVVSGRVQVVLSTVPIAILLLASFVVLGVQGSGGGAWGAYDHVVLPNAHGLALAFLPVYFAYSGWNAAIFVGAEIRDPGKNLPRALVGGTLSVTLLYLALCIGFLAVFTMADLAHTGEAGTAAARAMFGSAGELVVTLLILLAMLGCVNGSILTGSRISFAMAQQGDCVAPAGRLHPRYGTPAVALWLQCGWTILLVVTHGFTDLMKYASAAMLITGTLTVMSVVILRRRLPESPRPYRTWGYPFTPIAYAVSSLVVLGILANELDPSVFLGGGWFVVALLFHRLVLRPRRAMLPREAATPWRDARPG